MADARKASPAYHLLVAFLWASFVAAILRTAITKPEALWGTTEWAINYEGGFVRRGLTGQFALIASRLTDVSAFDIAFTASVAAFVLLLTMALVAVRRGQLAAWAVPSAALLGAPFYGDYAIRKDLLILAALGLCLWILACGWRLSVRLALVNVVSVAAVLSHEAFIVVALPALSVVVWTVSGRPSPHWVLRWIVLLPAWGVSLVVVVLTSPQRGAAVVWRSWFESGASLGLPGLNPARPDGAIAALDWNGTEALALFVRTFSSPWGYVWLLIAPVAVFLTVQAFPKVLGPRPGTGLWPGRLRSLVLLEVATSVVLWISGWDYSRWIFLMCGSIALVWGWNVRCLAAEVDGVEGTPGVGAIRRTVAMVAVALLFSTAPLGGHWRSTAYVFGMPAMQIPRLGFTVYQSLQGE